MASVKETTQTKITPREQLLRDLWDDINEAHYGLLTHDLEHWVSRFEKAGIDYKTNFEVEELSKLIAKKEDLYMVFDPAIFKESTYCRFLNETESIAQEYDAKKTPGELYQVVPTSHGLLPNNPLPNQIWRLKTDHEILFVVQKVVAFEKTFKVFHVQVSGNKWIEGINGLGEPAMLHLHFLESFEHMKNYYKTRKFKCGDAVRWVSNLYGVKPAGKIMSLQSGGYKVQFEYGDPLAHCEFFHDNDLVPVNATPAVIRWKEHWTMVLKPEIERRGITVATLLTDLSDDERRKLFGMRAVVEMKDDGSITRSDEGLSRLPTPESVCSAKSMYEWILENVSHTCGNMFWICYLANKRLKDAPSESEKPAVKCSPPKFKVGDLIKDSNGTIGQVHSVETEGLSVPHYEVKYVRLCSFYHPWYENDNDVYKKKCCETDILSMNFPKCSTFIPDKGVAWKTNPALKDLRPKFPNRLSVVDATRYLKDFLNVTQDLTECQMMGYKFNSRLFFVMRHCLQTLAGLELNTPHVDGDESHRQLINGNNLAHMAAYIWDEPALRFLQQFDYLKYKTAQNALNETCLEIAQRKGFSDIIEVCIDDDTFEAGEYQMAFQNGYKSVIGAKVYPNDADQSSKWYVNALNRGKEAARFLEKKPAPKTPERNGAVRGPPHVPKKRRAMSDESYNNNDLRKKPKTAMNLMKEMERSKSDSEKSE